MALPPPFHISRIYIVHDEVKDKAFELELSWVGESKYLLCLVSYIASIAGWSFLCARVGITSLKCHHSFPFTLKQTVIDRRF